jgi:hypothetical protein
MLESGHQPRHLVSFICVATVAWLRENNHKGSETLNKDRPMPPLIAFAGALGGLVLVRWAFRTAVRINQELQEIRSARVAEAAHANEIKTLRRDPATGAYRPG